jgi:hypothetical protein
LLLLVWVLVWLVEEGSEVLFDGMID